MKFSMKDFFSKCHQIRRICYRGMSNTKEILNGKLHFLYSDSVCSFTFIGKKGFDGHPEFLSICNNQVLSGIIFNETFKIVQGAETFHSFITHCNIEVTYEYKIVIFTTNKIQIV